MVVSLYTLKHELDSSLASRCLSVFDAQAMPEERQHAARLRNSALAIDYRLSHGFLRLSLSHEAEIPPHDIRLGRTALGKPVCGNGLFFSMSHTDRLTAIAVSSTVDVGLDVEALPQTAHESSLSAVRADEDTNLLASLSGSQADAEIILWSIKEATLKLTGDVMTDPRQLSARRLSDGGIKVGPSSLASAPVPETFVRLAPMPRPYILALASSRPIGPLEIVHKHLNNDPSFGHLI